MNLAKACVSAGSNRLPHARDALTRVQELLADQPTRSFTTLRALLLMSRVEDLEALSRCVAVLCMYFCSSAAHVVLTTVHDVAGTSPWQRQ